MRRLLSWWAGLLAVLGGCGAMLSTGGGVGCGGVYAPPPHPSVKLTRVQLKSPSTIKPGDKIEALAYTNKPTRDGTMRLQMNTQANCPNCGGYHNSQVATALMHDDGKSGDATAGDGEWYGSYTWAGTSSCNVDSYVLIEFARYSNDYKQLPLVKVDGNPPAGTAEPEDEEAAEEADPGADSDDQDQAP